MTLKVDPMLVPIAGIDTGASNLNRLPDIADNILNVRREFVGMPEVCHTLVSHIIHLRRNIDTEHHSTAFWYYLLRYKKTILKHYNVRWLLSILDTIVDIGDIAQSAIAMNIVQCINGTNIHYTLLVNAVDGNLDGGKLCREIKVPTWGGMITADVPTGDMIYNMMTRLDRVVANDRLLNDIWCEIKKRGRDNPNVILNHVCNASAFKHQRKFFQ